MIIDSFNLNLLRVFTAVYQSKNMSHASKVLFMSQSAVSQNIKNLEESLDFRLFDRVNKGLIPTSKATDLYVQCSKNLSQIDEALLEATRSTKSLRGVVKIGLPPEYGNNIVLKLLIEWGKLHPYIQFEIQYGLSSVMKNLILNGELDFAIIDGIGMDKELKVVNITKEALKLCASKEYLKQFGDIKYVHKYFDKLDYIDYAKHSPVLKAWFKHHLKFQNFSPSIKAHLMNVQGVTRMIQGGLGAGVLPTHLLKQMEIKNQSHDLHIFEDKNKPLYNALGMAYLEGRTYSETCLKTRKYLLENLR